MTVRHFATSLLGVVSCLAALSAAMPDSAGMARPAAAEPIARAARAAGAARALGHGIDAGAAGLDPHVLRLALTALNCAVTRGDLRTPPTLSVIDYSRPSLEPRLWVFDLPTGRLLFRELVAHGRNTGENLAVRFSDVLNSHQSSIGLFTTADTYVGANGYSLRLDGLEPGFNGRARDRAIVMHGAPYVDARTAAVQGRLGRSWGCPAVSQAVARPLIDTISGGGVLFAYYPDATWLKTSRFLGGCGDAAPRFTL